MRGTPDWKKLGEIAQRTRALKIAGWLDYATFRALLDEAERATNGNPHETDILSCFAEADWVQRLLAEEEQRVA